MGGEILHVLAGEEGAGFLRVHAAELGAGVHGLFAPFVGVFEIVDGGGRLLDGGGDFVELGLEVINGRFQLFDGGLILGGFRFHGLRLLLEFLHGGFHRGLRFLSGLLGDFLDGFFQLFFALLHLGLFRLDGGALFGQLFQLTALFGELVSGDNLFQAHVGHSFRKMASWRRFHASRVWRFTSRFLAEISVSG